MSVCAVMFALMLSVPVFAQQPQTSRPNGARTPVPTVDGDIGSCSLNVTVLNSHGRPVNNADVQLEAKYGGFFGRHSLELQGSTNADGKLLFAGLPEKTDGVAFVTATSGVLKGVAVYDPQNACENEHNIILAPSTPRPTSDDY